MVFPIVAKKSGEILEVKIRDTKLNLTRIDAINLRNALNSFINNEMTEKEEIET